MVRGEVGSPDTENSKRKRKSILLAYISIVYSMIDNVLETRLIPDLLIWIFRQNELIEDFGLYSAENQWLYQTRSRSSIMDKVLKEMIREVFNSSINTMVN